MQSISTNELPGTYSAWLRSSIPSGEKLGSPPSWTMRCAMLSACDCSALACSANSAATLFANKGYRDTSIAEVAARVGVSQQSLLYYFGSKSGLLHAVINQRDDASMQFVRQIAASGSSVSLEQLPDYARRNVERPDLARLFAVLVADNLHPDDEAHDHFVQRYRNLREVIETIIIGGQRSGDFSPDVDPGLKAIQIVAFIEGANLQWLLDPKSIDLVRASEDFAADFIRALTRRP